MTIQRIWNDLVQDESGQDLIEYALIAALIGALCVTALSSVQQAIATALGKITTALTT